MTAHGLLERCLEDAGYTPAQKALPALLEALDALDEERAELLERALARVGLPAAEAALAELAARAPAARRRRLRLVGRVAVATRAAALFEPLVRGLGDEDARCRRSAMSALGKLGDERAEGPLLALLERSALEERRVLVEALGKLGGRASREALAALSVEDPELERRRERALTLLGRRSSRADAVSLDFERPLPSPVTVVLTTRAGLAHLPCAELAHLGASRLSAREAQLSYGGTLGALFQARTALDFALRFPVVERGASAAERIARTLTDERVLASLAAWTHGRPRVRLAWTEGHKRAQSWEVARLLRERSDAIVNDPSGALWEVRLSPTGTGFVDLVPRVAPDPRFSYRVSDVPAASHPTLAAALARTAGARDDDVVWDPFVGSGLELVERAKLGPYAALYGTDLDARALDAARRNLESARVERATLERRDARTFARSDVTLVLSNPPMGRRVARDASLGALLEGVVETAARVLVPGGRMVWLSPQAPRTSAAAARCGFSVSEGPDVDLGGFSARLQTFEQRR